ncbi:response regulator [Sphingorhabdus sp. IMCC26285]|uniref:Response regulator n=1 Tax=Sphingorhabdus profundilacus TaxID=2509718 RepID=A0A6I4M102_9SPHN|nr:response regulator [Sphingorhabdus profundilacus]MVZ96098.1 response regulator [Sphingorhabdus profundilacus]
MSLKAAVAPELPFLRRYARALTGSQKMGDAAVRQVLEGLLLAPEELDAQKPARVELYRIFHQLWRHDALVEPSGGDGLVARLPVQGRQALLLTAVEGFSMQEAAEILGSDVESVSANSAIARQSITDSLQSSVMIIEDEAIIALHIRSIVEALGHSVTGVARTRSEAVALAARTQPELVLADISLADGSSGIDAVKDILGAMNVPVIFITAFPERLLTGERPEPTYLITKPFEPETVIATIGQALLVHRERLAAAAPAILAMDDMTPNPRKHFDTPEALLADPQLADGDKQALLTEWDSEMDNRLNAESEGMSASDPISAKREAQLADEARKVKNALTRISGQPD